MRYLTIQRKKAFPACMAPAQVYIEDPNGELTIAGSPCRLLGTLKNGEQKSFLVDEESRQVFLIFKPRTKDKLNSSVTIPAGAANVFLTGKYAMDGGAFPFRFEGVPLTPQQQERAQMQKKKQKRSTILGVILGTILGIGLVFLGGHFAGKAEAKTFIQGEFSITLNEDFEKADLGDYYAGFESDDVVVVANREDKSYFGNISLEQYAQLVQKNDPSLQLRRENGLICMTYTRTVDGMEYFYMLFCYESQDAFWTVNFATPVGFRKNHEKHFIEWAGTVKISQFSQL